MSALIRIITGGITLKFMLIRLIRINYTFIAVMINYFQKIIRLSLKRPDSFVHDD